jgi:hypothetical protein
MKIEIGAKFDRLTVTRYVGYLDFGTYKRDVYEVECLCGNRKEVHADSLLRRLTRSCGCLTKERLYKHGRGADTSGTYQTWVTMKQRCANSNDPYYGGKGIRVCDRWQNSFENFLLDMGERPKGTTLDRIDGNGNYSPKNCRWATPIEQQNNRRDNAFITVGDVTLTVPAWSRKTGISQDAIRSRIKRGWRPEDAISYPPRNGYRPPTSPL